eukprot:3551437-Amphidinium_carterae.3
MFGGLPGRSAQQLLARVLLLAEQGGEQQNGLKQSACGMKGARGSRASMFVAQLDVEKYFNGIDTPGLHGAFEALGLGAFGVLLTKHCCDYSVFNKFWGAHTGCEYHLVRGAPQGDPWSMWLSLVHVLLLINNAKLEVGGEWACFACIDDLTITAPSKVTMFAVVSSVATLLGKFGLVLNWAKSSWTSNCGCGDEDSAAGEDSESVPSALPYVKQSVLLGADLCCLEEMPEISTKRESRVAESKARLLRARHLPCHERRRAMLISSTAMAPMGWIPVGPRPSTKDLRVLRNSVLRAIFGHATYYRESAYEVVVCVLHQGHRLDPSWQCLHELGVMAMEAFIADPAAARAAFERETFLPAGLFATLKYAAEELGAVLRGCELACPTTGATFSLLVEPSASSKHDLREFVRNILLTRLEQRRVGEFAGVSAGVDGISSRRMVTCQPTAAKQTLARRWLTGAFLTADRWVRHNRSGHGAVCSTCGVRETWVHVLWHCPRWLRYRTWCKPGAPCFDDLPVCTRVCGLVLKGSSLDIAWLRAFALGAVELYARYHELKDECYPDRWLDAPQELTGAKPPKDIPFDAFPPPVLVRRRIRSKRPITFLEGLAEKAEGVWLHAGHQISTYTSARGAKRYRCVACGLTAAPHQRRVWLQHTCAGSRAKTKQVRLAARGKQKQSAGARLQQAIAISHPHIGVLRQGSSVKVLCGNCGTTRQARPITRIESFALEHASCCGSC